jgi:hypothetical protein
MRERGSHHGNRQPRQADDCEEHLVVHGVPLSLIRQKWPESLRKTLLMTGRLKNGPLSCLGQVPSTVLSLLELPAILHEMGETSFRHLSTLQYFFSRGRAIAPDESDRPS